MSGAHTRHLTSPRLLPIWRLFMQRYDRGLPGPTTAEVHELTGTMAASTDIDEIRRIVRPLGWTILPARFVERVGRSKRFRYDIQRTDAHQSATSKDVAPADSQGSGKILTPPAFPRPDMDGKPGLEDRPFPNEEDRKEEGRYR